MIVMEKCNWANPKTLAISFYLCERKVSGSPEVNKLKAPNERDKTLKVLNRDNDNYVTSSPYRPFFIKMGNYSTVNMLT